MNKSELKSAYLKLKESGKIVTFDKYIQSEGVSKLNVSGRSGDSNETTIIKMAEKRDQLVKLPEFRPVKDPKLEQLKFFVNIREDMQKRRIAYGNRIIALMRHKLEIPPDATQAEIEKLTIKAIDVFGKAYRSIMNILIDGKKIVKYKQEDQPMILNRYFEDDAKPEDFISELAEFNIIGAFLDVYKMERFAESKLEGAMSDMPMWTGCLEHVTGIGPVIGAIFIARIDIHRTTSPGSLHRLFGITVEKDNRATSARREHNVPTEYIMKNGDLGYKWGTGYNKQLQSFITNKVMGSFMRVQKPNPWREELRRKKQQYTLMEKHAVADKKTEDGIKRDRNGKHIPNKGHIDKMAKRWCSKIFLNDLWLFWAAFEGVEIKLPYWDAKIEKIRHSSKNNWDLMIERLGNPLTLRKQIYGQEDGIPKCYLEN